jgi:hypothetical protein
MKELLMMKNDPVGDRPLQEGDLQISKTYLTHISKLNTRECLPGSVVLFGDVFPTICMSLTLADVKYFGLKKPPYSFEWKFRYLDYFENELIEFNFRFHKMRIMATVFNPIEENVRTFLEMVQNIKGFGLIFYCRENTTFAATFTFTDRETNDWLKRNVERSKKLKTNAMHPILEFRESHVKSNERIYRGQGAKGNGMSGPLVSFESIGDVLR